MMMIARWTDAGRGKWVMSSMLIMMIGEMQSEMMRVVVVVAAAAWVSYRLRNLLSQVWVVP